MENQVTRDQLRILTIIAVLYTNNVAHFDGLEMSPNLNASIATKYGYELESLAKISLQFEVMALQEFCDYKLSLLTKLWVPHT